MIDGGGCGGEYDEDEDHNDDVDSFLNETFLSTLIPEDVSNFSYFRTQNFKQYRT